jgi:ubiquinone/menaquinone biosynthesis C-methylase UbiE
MPAKIVPSETPQSGLGYRLMVFFMKHSKKEAFVTRLLQSSQVIPGAIVLDYASGPGIFTIPAAKITGSEGHVYAADINPQAIKDVRSYAAREHLDNITAIQTACETGLDSGSVDVVLLFDCFHNFKEPVPILTELHRVLKDGGYLSLEVDHGTAEGPIAVIESTGLFNRVDQPSFHQQILFKK